MHTASIVVLTIVIWYVLERVFLTVVKRVAPEWYLAFCKRFYKKLVKGLE